MSAFDNQVEDFINILASQPMMQFTKNMISHGQASASYHEYGFSGLAGMEHWPAAVVTAAAITKVDPDSRLELHLNSSQADALNFTMTMSPRYKDAFPTPLVLQEAEKIIKGLHHIAKESAQPPHVIAATADTAPLDMEQLLNACFYGALQASRKESKLGISCFYRLPDGAEVVDKNGKTHSGLVQGDVMDEYCRQQQKHGIITIPSAYFSHAVLNEQAIHTFREMMGMYQQAHSDKSPDHLRANRHLAQKLAQDWRQFVHQTGRNDPGVILQ